jgi:hypothetical protein
MAAEQQIGGPDGPDPEVASTGKAPDTPDPTDGTSTASPGKAPDTPDPTDVASTVSDGGVQGPPPPPKAPVSAVNAPQEKRSDYIATVLKEAPWGAVVIIVGLLTIIAIFVTAILHYKQASEVATATSSVSGVIAALVGAYFGIRGSSLAQEKAQENPRLPSGNANQTGHEGGAPPKP